jgi:hypothetical protein
MCGLAIGVKVVKGSHSDLDIIEEQASKADIVLNAADADDLDLTNAILRGIKRTSIGKKPILIHTSGTGLAIRDGDGKFRPDDKVWNVSVGESLVEDLMLMVDRMIVWRIFARFQRMLSIAR